MVDSKSNEPGATSRVRITPAINRDFERRQVFHALRIEKAERMANGAGVFEVPAGFAAEVLADAIAQYAVTARGLKKAYGTLRDSLQPDAPTEERPEASAAVAPATQEVWQDPGLEVARQRMAESSAQFRVGEWVRYWSEWTDDNEDGARMEIVGAYALYVVRSEDGPFFDKEGGRIAYRWGYLAKSRMGAPTFYPAYNLQRIDYRRGYLSLVALQTAHAASGRP